MTSDKKIEYQVHDYNIEPAMVGDSLNQKGERWNWYHEEDGKFIKTDQDVGSKSYLSDPVSRPAHYTSGNVECIDAMKEAFGETDLKAFCRLNAFKYLWRAENKESEVQDIEKAIWYLRMSIGDDPRKT